MIDIDVSNGVFMFWRWPYSMNDSYILKLVGYMRLYMIRKILKVQVFNIF